MSRIDRVSLERADQVGCGRTDARTNGRTHGRRPGKTARLRGIGANFSDSRAQARRERRLPAGKRVGNVKKDGLRQDRCNAPIRLGQALADCQS